MAFTVVLRAGWITLMHGAEVLARRTSAPQGTTSSSAMVRRGREIAEGFAAA